MRSPYYTNEDIESVIADLENETENSMKIALRIVLCMLKDIRDNQIKNKQKVYTEPTDNKEDIIVGNGYNPLQEGYIPKPLDNTTGSEIIPPQNGTGECKCSKDIIVGRTHENPNGYMVPTKRQMKKIQDCKCPICKSGK